VLTALGSYYIINDGLTREAQAASRKDGRPRLPPGQRVIEALKPMGGTPGDPRRSQFRLRVHGEVKQPFSVDFKEFLKLPQLTQECDVHCVTGWSVLGAKFVGPRLSELAKRAQLKAGVRHVIFEAAHGYTANLPLAEAMKPNVLVAHRLDGAPLARTHGGPARSLVPDLYFWKSAKWLTGIRFVRSDEPGYWETRGYNNYADPWLEQRYA
jgi:DMSO/TMAO reductase YedYZ molybdopterin-dependent catalytic subunit